MDRLSRYQLLVKQTLSSLAEQFSNSVNDMVETELVIDDLHGHYMLFEIGWIEHDRIQRQIAHVRIKNGKLWIEEDWTEDGIVSFFTAAGVPNEDIVLAFNPPDMRELTEYAVA